MRFGRPALVMFVMALAVSAVSAQTGGIKIKVTDANGPLPGATVTISHETGYVKETAVQTDRNGMVAFPVLRATGTTGIGYTVTVIMPGFAQQRIGDVKVRIGETTTLPIQLSEEIVERVKVTARTEVVDLERSEHTTKFSDEFIQDLPVPGRFYQNVLTLAPGVQDADGDGNPNVHGARNRDFKAIVSGVSNVDPLSGQQMSQVNPNSIEEMEVITAGAGVEFSRAQGGFARILQKQGSNDFEGVFELYYRSDILDGDGAGDFSSVTDPGFRDINPSIQVSGPIIKDKLWYRASHDIIDREIPTNTTTGIVVVEDEWKINSDQLTWQVSPRNKLAFQFQSDPRTIDKFGVSSLTPEESSLLFDNKTETFSVTWTAPFSPKILIESQVHWQDLSLNALPHSPGEKNDCLIGPEFLESARCFNIETGETSGSFPFEWRDNRQRLTARGDVTLYGGRFWGMTHQFKLGMIVENERYFRDLQINPDVNFFIFSPVDDPDDDKKPEPLALIFGEFGVPDRTQVRATGITWGLYAEDQIKPLQNLTITVGARIDREEIDSNGQQPFFPEGEFDTYNTLVAGGIPDEQALQIPFTKYPNLNDFYAQLASTLEVPFATIFENQTTAAVASTFWDRTRLAENIQVSNTNLSPFLSVAWDPWSNGKTKLAATARRYYDKLFLNIPLLEIDPATAFVAFEANPVAGSWQVPPGEFALRSSVSPAVNVDLVDRQLKTPRQDEWTLSFEREIAAETSVKVTYVNRKFRDQLQDTDLNHVPGDFGRCRLATLTNANTIVPVNVGDPDFDPAFAPGDGIVDDCQGEIEVLPGADPEEAFSEGTRIERPDGIEDLYVQNPGWGNVFFLGNINQIDYEAFVLELIRRQYRSWEFQGSYTWSMAEGDGEDFKQDVGNDRTLVEDERGYQSYDQRHVVKLSATTITPWGFRLGGSVIWQSGLPYSILERKTAFDATPPIFQNVGAGGAGRPRTTYPSNQRNSERNDSYWDFNLKFTKELAIGRRVNMQVSAEVFNLLNDNTFIVFDPVSETGRQINGRQEGFRRFGRRWELGLKMAF